MTDWPDLLEPVALELLGEPSRRTTSGEWRYGRKGSLAVHVAGDRAGTWRDHEAAAGAASSISWNTSRGSTGPRPWTGCAGAGS